MNGDLERVKEILDRLPKCAKCGHNPLVHTFIFPHPKLDRPTEAVGCNGEFNRNDCDCTGWSEE